MAEIAIVGRFHKYLANLFALGDLFNPTHYFGVMFT